MASGGKKKTTMAKLDRERRMRERRMDKQARKDARKQLAASGGAEATDEATGETLSADGSEEPGLETAGTLRSDG